MEDDSMF
jgi:hypothetical protein